MDVALDGTSLTIDDVAAVAFGSAPVSITKDARARMRVARAVVEAASARGEPVYGLTTGVAERKRVAVASGDASRFNRLMVQSHRVGQGPAAPAPVVRATMLCLANGYAKGAAGVRPEL